MAYKTSAPGYPITRRNFTSISTTTQPFPFRYDCKLTYGVNVTLTTAGSSSAGVTNVFRLNSLYDPDLTGTGHQPYQYDQMTAIYSKYLVKHAFIDLTFTDPTADGLWVGWCIQPDSDGESPTTLQLYDIMERPNWKAIPLNNTGAQAVTARLSIPMHELFGVSKAQYVNETGSYAASYNASPSQQALLKVFLIDPTALVSQHSIRVAGRIVFDSQFFGYVAVNGS